MTINNSENEMEEKLCQIWQEVLKTEKVGINDNFFELGGNSILAIEIISQIKQMYGIEVPLRILFAKQTAHNLADSIKIAFLKEVPIPSVSLNMDIQEDMELLSLDQQQLWFRFNLVAKEESTDIPMVVRLIGPLDLTLLQRSFVELNHRYKMIAENLFNTQIESLKRIDMRAFSERKQDLQKLIMEEAIWTSEPDNPLVQVKLFQEKETVNVLMIIINSNIDLMLSGILIKQLLFTYQSFLQEDSSQPKSSSTNP